MVRELLRTRAQARPPSGLMRSPSSDILRLMAGCIRPLTVAGMKSLSHHPSLEARNGSLLWTRAASLWSAAQGGR